MHLFPSPSAGLSNRSIQASRHFVVRHFSLLLVLLLAVAAVCVFVRRSGALSLVGPIPFAATDSPAEAGGKGNPAGTFGNHAVTLPAGATFEVNSTADTNNGSCSAAPNGCTLRDAINAANANPGADTITFSSTVFAAPGPYTISLSTALPDITTDMTIQGPGAKVLTVERNSTAAKFRIFTIASGTVAISGLTITKGLTADGAGGPNGGACCFGRRHLQ
jgi:CSLREA domain-containing protein